MKSKQLSNNIIWYTLGSGLNSCISLIFILAATRINGIEAAGLLSVCFSITFIMQTLVYLGNRVFEVSDLKTDDSVYFTLKVFVSAITAVITLLFCFLSSYSFSKTIVVFILLFVRIIEAFSDTYYAVIQKQERLDLVGISYLFKCVLSLLVFIIVDLITRNLVFSALGMLISTFAVYLFYDRKIVSLFQRPHFHRSMISFCSSLAASMLFFIAFNFIITLIANVPRLIADSQLSEAEMGFFSILFMVPSVMNLFSQFIIQPFLTSMTESVQLNQTGRLKHTVRLISAAIIGFCAVCSAAAYLIGAPILSFVFGNDFSAYSLSMVLALVAGMFSVLTILLSNVLTIMRRTLSQLVCYVLTLLTEMISVYYAATHLSFTGIFAVYSAVMLLQFIMFYVIYCSAIRKNTLLENSAR